MRSVTNTALLTEQSFTGVVDYLESHKQIRWILSDIDGTLLDPIAVVDLYVTAARSTGIDVNGSDVLCWLGKIPIQDPAVAARTIFKGKQASIDRIASIIRQYEASFNQVSSEYFQRFLYPDIADALTKLSAMGIGLGIISNRYESLALHQIAGTCISGFVGQNPAYRRTQGLAVCGGDTPALERGEWHEGKVGQLEVHLTKLSITPESAVVVGDQFDSDMSAAQALGIPGILIQRVS